jgi:hypothetical protein
MQQTEKQKTEAATYDRKMAEYLWLKAQADLADRLAAAAWKKQLQ